MALIKRKETRFRLEYTSSLSIYEWEDESQRTIGILVANVCKKEEESIASQGRLFNDSKKVLKLTIYYQNIKK